jgi:hypothetical protein
MEQGFRSGLQGGRYGHDPSNNDPGYGGGGYGGYRGNRRNKGGLISGIIGGVIGAVEGQKHPVQDIKSGGRPTTPSNNGSGAPHTQTTGVYPAGAHNSQGTVSPSQQSHVPQYEPPPYEPRQ